MVDCGRKESLEDLGGQETRSARPKVRRGRGGSPGWACSAPSLDFWLVLAVAQAELSSSRGDPWESSRRASGQSLGCPTYAFYFFPWGRKKKAPNYSVLAGMG